MSITRDEAYNLMNDELSKWIKWGPEPNSLHGKMMQAVQMSLNALRTPTREMVERMFRGCADCQRKTCVACRRFGRVQKWCIDCDNQNNWMPWNFCPVCGKPLTDEAVDIMLERWKEAVKNA